MQKLLLFPVLVFGSFLYTSFRTPSSQAAISTPPPAAAIKTGAEQTAKYLHLLKGKRVGILGNQTTVIGKTHLVDSLKSLGINIVKAFGPEHGFRGQASAGVKVKDEVDKATGIPIVSLYGNKRKPSKEDMAGIDIMVFDIQDVGCRFYTYI